MRTRVKICGITNLDDALMAINCGADAIGLVFYPPSSRNIDIRQAAEIVKQLPPFISVVGLFVNAEPAVINTVINTVGIDLIQFHGDEQESFCRQFGRPYIKALRMKAGLDLKQSVVDFASARALLLDTYVKGIPGGTGETFNWDLVPHDLDKAIVLAGGLVAGNVAQAITTARPYAVDVSGGVEEQPGIKDVHKVKDFINTVRTSEYL